jgi:PAS domain S-box-containing protein
VVSRTRDEAGAAAGSSWALAGVGLSWSSRVASASALAVAVFGISVLVGWASGIDFLTSWNPDFVHTKVNAAFCFTLLGLAILLQTGFTSSRPRWPARAAAVIVLAIAGATLLEHFASVNLGIDEVFRADTVSAASPHPGRFAIQTALAFTSAALAVLVLGQRYRGFHPAQAMAVACGAIGFVSLLGYLFGADALRSIGSATQISLPASAFLIVTGVALLAADPEHALVRLAADRGIAGQVLRRFVPAALLVVPLGAWLRLLGERAGIYDAAVGLSIMVGLEALVLLAVGAWTTSRAASIEEQRREAQADLIRLGAVASTPLIETAPVGLAVLDRDLRCLYVNPALAEIGGVSPLASLGRRIDRIVPAVAGEHLAALERVLATGAALREEEVVGPTNAAGNLGTLLLSAEALRDSTAEVTGLTISVIEITERKHREEALAAIAELRRQAHAIGESIPFGIWVASPDGQMQYLSQSFLGMAGRKIEQAAGSGWMSALAPETVAQTRRDWAETVATQSPWNHELVVQDVDGRRRTILSRGLPVRDEVGTVTSWAGINLDITDRKDAEAFREAFMGILSHELRTPITSIYAASTLLSRPGLDPSRQAELLDDIGHEAERLRRLVEDLVILARTERGTIQVHTEPVPLQHILPRVCDQEQRRWPGITFELRILGPLPIARADEAFVEQIVRNLLGNAAKYGPPDGHVELVVDALDGWPRVRVLDRGPGVDPAEAERLFEVFYRSERTSKVAGSGIGLFVAHRLVESIGGSIWAKPRDDGPGAEFGFKLQPLHDDGPEHAWT